MKYTMERTYLHHHSYYINLKSVICTYTLFLQEREYREMKQNRRSKHKGINDMLNNTILTLQHTRKE